MTRRLESRVGVIGAGAWGTAVAKVLADKGLPVDLWCREKDLSEHVNTAHVNEPFLPGIALPPSIHATTDLLEAASGKGYIFLAVPSLFLQGIAADMTSRIHLHSDRTVISVLTKGLIDAGEGPHLITDALEEILPGSYKNKLVAVSGPSHAMEVAMGKITGLVSASRSGKNSIRVRELLSGGLLVVVSSLDIRGVQVSGALKNVIAIAFGMLDALKETSDQFGDNTESLLLAAGLSEIQIVGKKMGATHPETFSSIAGVGDLDVTCRSVLGRNRRFGREIVLKGILERFRSIEELIADLPSIGYIPEGVATVRHLHALAEQKGLILPISSGVYRVLNREVEPLGEVANIIERIIGTGIRARKNKRFTGFIGGTLRKAGGHAG